MNACGECDTLVAMAASRDALEVSLEAPTGASVLHPGDAIEIRWKSRGARGHDLEATVEGAAVPIAVGLAAEARHQVWTIPADLLKGRVRVELRLRLIARAEHAQAEATSVAIAVVPRRVPTMPPPPSRAANAFALVSIDPKLGPATGGTSITVHGCGFERFTVVRVGGRDASTTFVSPAVLQVIAPPTLHPGLADVAARNADARTAVLPRVFRYEPVPAPEVHALEPRQGGSVGGTRVTLVGARFGPGSLVTLGGSRPASTMFVDPSTLEIVTPAHAQHGLVDVEVTNVDGQTVLVRNAFRYDPAPAPELAAIVPRRGPARGGARVTLLGRGFGPHSVVRFGELDAPVTFKSTTELEVDAPPSPAGIVDVQVKSPDGETTVARRAFQYD